MPNGISCAYFAARNAVYGTKEKNLFKEGIAAAQAARTVDAVVNAPMKGLTFSGGVKNCFSKLSALASKLLYPLIIASGIYNTIKSEDKVRAGCSQAAGITAMAAFESSLAFVQKKAIPDLVSKYGSKVPENMTKIVSKGVNFLNTNKYGKIAKYVLQGVLFATVSMTGYNTGSKTAEKIVDKYRSHIQKDNVLLKEKLSQTGKSQVFDDMKL